RRTSWPRDWSSGVCSSDLVVLALAFDVYWSVAGALVDVEGERKNNKGPVIYKKGGTKYTVPSKESGGPRIVKHPDNEKPSGQWKDRKSVVQGNRVKENSDT